MRWQIGHLLTTKVKPIFDRHNLKVLSELMPDLSSLIPILLWKGGLRRPFKVSVMGRDFEVLSEEDFFILNHLMRLFSSGFEFQTFQITSEVKFKYNARELKIHYGSLPYLDVLSLLDKFAGIDSKYNVLDVSGRDVVDIGANIGDTAIFYSLRGARNVIALEPNRFFYNLALENIRINNLTNINTLNEAGGKPATMLIRSMESNRMGLPLMKVVNGTEVKVKSIDALAEEFNFDDAVLKVVCVGCEQEFFKFSSDRNIKRFNQILVVNINENGYLRNRLKSIGYRVRIISRDYVINPHLAQPRLTVSSVLAIRK